jgi:protocatechuate 3,4-dioxygenase beta subunit
MKRSRFLSLAGLSFLAAIFSSSKKTKIPHEVTGCNDPVTPPVPEGPYYKDEHLNRIDITEKRPGLPVEYVFRVEDKNCKPIKHAKVDIWQCDVHGHYSDFKQENTVNETWLRGHQFTDEKGECRFQSIFPGWYNGRLTHLHAKVHVGGVVVLTTNFFFPKEIEQEVYATSLYPKGPNPVTMQQDFELSGDKDASRLNTLIMKISQDKMGKMIAGYTIAV